MVFDLKCVVFDAFHRMALWLADIDGKNPKALTKAGWNLVPSWIPDSKHIVWMITQPGEDPTRDSQLHLMNTETGESRRLFTDPEQINGDGVDARSDVYGLGVLLYEVLTGSPPLERRDEPGVAFAERVRTDDPPRPSVRAALQRWANSSH